MRTGVVCGPISTEREHGVESWGPNPTTKRKAKGLVEEFLLSRLRELSLIGSSLAMVLDSPMTNGMP